MVVPDNNKASTKWRLPSCTGNQEIINKHSDTVTMSGSYMKLQDGKTQVVIFQVKFSKILGEICIL